MLALTLALAAEADMEGVVRETLSAMKAKLVDRFEDKSGLLRPAQYFRTPLSLSAATAAIRKAGWSPLGKRNSENAFRFGDREMTLAHMGAGSESHLAAAITRMPVHLRSLQEKREKLLYQDISDDSFTTLIGEGAINTILFPAGRSDRLLFIASNWFEGPDGKRYEMGIGCWGYVDGKAKRLWVVDLVPDKSAPSGGTLDRYLRGLEVYLDSEPRRGWRFATAPREAMGDNAAETGWAAYSESSGDGGDSVGFIGPDGKARWAHYLNEYAITAGEERFLTK